MKFKKIRSIRNSLTEPILHLTVKNNHNFFANSMCVHNCDYRDELKIILINCGIEPWSANIGDRICQGVLSPVIQMEIAEIKEFSQEAKENDRGGGFGSTGIAST